jgi:type IX secretion system PorP/SprF family membrane protein
MKLFNKIYTTLLAGALICGSAQAQDRSNFYTNLLNPFLSNPAMAGSQENIHAVFNAKTLVGGIESSPRLVNFGIHTPFARNTGGIGAKVISQWSGAFQTVNAEAAYSKLVRLTTNHTLSLGLSMGFAQTNLRTDLFTSQVNLADPTFNSSSLNKVLLTAGAGMVYRYKKQLEVYASSPMMLTGAQSLNGFFIAGAKYVFNLDEDGTYRLRPMVNYYNFVAAPKLVDVLANVSWNETVSFTTGYRTNGAVVAGLGFNFKNVLVSYNYYHNTGNLHNLAPASNEIAIAFNFKKPERQVKKKPEVVNEQIITDQIDKVNDKINGLINIEKSNPGLVNVKNEMVKLNKELERILTKYKIENIDQLKRIKELQTNIELLIAKYND